MFAMSHETGTSDDESSAVQDSSESSSIILNESYHKSVCGLILHSSPTNCSSEIFSYLYHGNLDVFRRSLHLYHKDIIQLKNSHGQSVLHVLSIHAHPYPWIRLLLMLGCDPCCQDIDGYTPAHYVAERDDVEMLKALTTRFHEQVKLFSEQRTTDIHERCLKALSIRQKQGLTVFMISCYHQSMKCLDYLLSLNINHANLQDNFGDTCLHYAVAHRNENLVTKLIEQCNANINGSHESRPTALDILKFNREQQKPFDRMKDDSIEQILRSHNALSRCQIQCSSNKRKHFNDDNEEVISKLARLKTNPSIEFQREIAKDYARIALSLQSKLDINGAKENYRHAMDSIPDNIPDWADYAFYLSLLHRIHGENHLALDLLQRALAVRKEFENDTEQINRIQRTIDHIKKPD